MVYHFLLGRLVNEISSTHTQIKHVKHWLGNSRHLISHMSLFVVKLTKRNLVCLPLEAWEEKWDAWWGGVILFSTINWTHGGSLIPSHSSSVGLERDQEAQRSGKDKKEARRKWPLLFSPNANFNCNLQVYFRRKHLGPSILSNCCLPWRCGEEKKKKHHFLQSGAGKAEWKCNFTRLSSWSCASLFAAVTQRKTRLSPDILMCFGAETRAE